MAYDYDVDILAALWTGTEDAKEPYLSFIAANPDLTDEVSENRILSTIELLRSHMELLQTRGEAKLLHESISKLFRHTAGGSNPWSDAAAITDAVGNVCNPVFPAFASIDITIGGVTNSHSSETGGDCQTVAAELNETLDATAGGVTEQTTIDTTGATVSGLSGTSFNINSAGDVTPYYVWFDTVAVAETTSVTPNGDVDGDLGETRFRLNTAAGADFYVWLSHDGRAEVTEIEVPGAGDTDGDLGETHFIMETPAAAQFFVWLSHDGRAEAMTLDFTGITGGTLPTGAVAAAYFDIDSTTALYRLWFSDGSTIVPAAGGRVLTPVVFTGADADTVIATAVIGALTGADADFAGFAGTPSITGTLASVGNVTDPVDGAVATGAAFSSTTQGLSAAESAPAAEGTGLEATYTVGDGPITIKDALITAIDANGSWDAVSDSEHVLLMTPTTVGPAFDSADVDTGFSISTTAQGVAAAESEPAGEGTGIEVPYTVGDGSGAIGTAIRIAVGANGAFNTEGNDPVIVVNAVAGDAADSDDVDTGFVIATTVQGVDAAVDPAIGGRTAIPVSLAAGLADSEIGSLIRSTVGANADFFTEGVGNSSEINNADNGVTTDSADTDSGLGVSTTRQGVDTVSDAFPITAICIQPGNKLGFRAQEDFLTFTLANGGGGIIGPAGIIPGARASKPKQVADQGRDLSLGHIAGTQG